MWLGLLLYASTVMFPPLSSVRERENNQVFFSLSLARRAKFRATCSVYLYYVYGIAHVSVLLYFSG